jgi:hypothetical protein
MDSDEEDEAIMNESLRYPDFGPKRFNFFSEVCGEILEYSNVKEHTCHKNR